ncbi:S-adenosyl-L-methionine-dependent methyltransferase [Chaetomium fimeti]|uniref:S-adenosyl-L-methionine-dependent methyltransferase n=1 Tax=Chaetomium fimeti TaxID=1854472 RepID=A0AAE0H7G8_9PEZI|nr:S-adenosyl-L-methionine-dependent methyltransferase [Chaetomium fimeti]
MGSNSNEIFAQDDKFWDNYLKGRPRVPDSFFTRIFDYHQANGGAFGTIHDVGAGNGVYALRLRSRFSHVLVSDVVPENVDLARQRLRGTQGFSFRVAALEDSANIAPGSVDMVFAANVMHFPDPQAGAMAAVARQLRPGGTFCAAVFGPARFRDAALQDLWARISEQGGRQLLLKAADDAARAKTIGVMARTQGVYNVAPLDPSLFRAGAKRIHLNMREGGVQGMLPPEEAHRNTEPDYAGPDDVEVHETDEGWDFEADLAGVKEHFNSFPFISQFPDAFKDLYEELEVMAERAPFQGYYPVKIILGTRC